MVAATSTVSHFPTNVVVPPPDYTHPPPNYVPVCIRFFLTAHFLKNEIFENASVLVYGSRKRVVEMDLFSNFGDVSEFKKTI